MAINEELLLDAASQILRNTGISGEVKDVAAALRVFAANDLKDASFFRNLDSRGIQDLGNLILESVDEGPSLVITPEKVRAVGEGMRGIEEQRAFVGELSGSGSEATKRRRFEEIFEGREKARPRSTRGRTGRPLPASSVDIFDLVDSPQEMADFDLPLPRDGKMAPGGVTAFDDPIGPDPKARLRDRLRGKKPAGVLEAAKGATKGSAAISAFGKVASGLGVGFLIYDLLRNYGEAQNAPKEFRRDQLMNADFSGLTGDSLSSQVDASEALRGIAEAGASGSMRPSRELLSVIEGHEDSIQDIRQKVKPSMTEAYARAGLL